MPNPLENKLLLYYMNALGSGLMDEDHPMQAVAGVTKQQIAAESQMKLIQKFLSGGGSLSQKEGKLQYAGDVSAFLAGGDEKTPFAGAPSGMAMNAPTGMQDTKEKTMMQSFLNPSPSPLNISGADLVGLTPENISQALQLKLTSESLEQKKLSDIQDMIYKQKVLKSKDTRSAKVKTFEYAKEQGYKGSFIDFQNISETTHKKDFDEAVEGGYGGTFNDWMLEMAKAGAINLGEVTGREVSKGLGKDQAEVMSPDYPQIVKEDLMKDKANWPKESLIERYTDKGLSYAEAEDRAQKRMVLEEMDSRIRQAFKGKDVTTGDDGWYVDGELKVRYP